MRGEKRRWGEVGRGRKRRGSREEVKRSEKSGERWEEAGRGEERGKG